MVKITEDFLKRADANKNKDQGKRPGFLERAAVENQWLGVVIGSEIVFRAAGKDYELSRKMMEHYLTADGTPMVYEPPEAMQKALQKRFPSPGHFPNVSGYEKWGTPDMRNGLGHFNLDVVPDETGKGLIYAITDRYEFPDKANGKQVFHGFQVGKLAKKTADQVNDKLSVLGQYQRDSGTKEKFELKKDPSSGEYTFMVPQKLLVDHGTDFESLGAFGAPRPGVQGGGR